MVWKYLFDAGIGAHQRCLDVGCGSGLLATQLALNGATHVHAIDVDPRAVANTMTNAFRNDVADQVTAAAVDIFPWVPEERYEVVVACLLQRPVDARETAHAHRVVDYWGRHLIDRLISKLGEALVPGGVAYIMQLSILSQKRTAELLDAAGFEARVVDHTLAPFPADYGATGAQINAVESLSDAYHLLVGERDVMVAYLLEINAKGEGRSPRRTPWHE